MIDKIINRGEIDLIRDKVQKFIRFHEIMFGNSPRGTRAFNSALLMFSKKRYFLNMDKVCEAKKEVERIVNKSYNDYQLFGIDRIKLANAYMQLVIFDLLFWDRLNLDDKVLVIEGGFPLKGLVDNNLIDSSLIDSNYVFLPESRFINDRVDEFCQFEEVGINESDFDEIKSKINQLIEVRSISSDSIDIIVANEFKKLLDSIEWSNETKSSINEKAELFLAYFMSNDIDKQTKGDVKKAAKNRILFSGDEAKLREIFINLQDEYNAFISDSVTFDQFKSLFSNKSDNIVPIKWLQGPMTLSCFIDMFTSKPYVKKPKGFWNATVACFIADDGSLFDSGILANSLMNFNDEYVSKSQEMLNQVERLRQIIG